MEFELSNRSAYMQGGNLDIFFIDWILESITSYMLENYGHVTNTPWCM